MKNLFRISSPVLIVFVLLFAGCKPEPEPTDLTQNSIIPKPLHVSATRSVFSLETSTTIHLGEDTEEMRNQGEYLSMKLKPATGFDLPVEITSEPSEGIYLGLIDDEELGDEGYELNITEEILSLQANMPAGIFRGIQTIRQLLPAGIEASSIQNIDWQLPTGLIRDIPEYLYRGTMLDVSRHFFSVEDVKRCIELMAYYKINHFHLHLSDDQGWRIEIKSWPNLTAHGAQTEVGGGEGGFFTQEDYSEIVEYAADHYITIVPEIDMPGHTNAVLASYPELNCDDQARELYTGTKVGFSTLCTSKEVTYQFIDDVMRELAELTPGPYIHIGGDESDVTPKEDYIPFIERVQEIVNSHGKQMIGWDEIGQSGVNETTVIQLWEHADFGREAIGKGSKLIMSPAFKAYLDMKYDSTTELGLDWAATIEVDEGYNWDPASLMDGIGSEDIIGVEAPLWSETITNMDELEFLAYPRLPGYAEIGWTNTDMRDWEEYKVRLGAHGPRLRLMGVDYYPSELVPWE